MLTIDLRGNLAVITGASGMLGRVIARTFADCGADLVLHYFHGKEEAEALAGELRRKTGRRVMTVQADITSAEDVQRMKQEILNRAGVPDILVHNAVIQYDRKPVIEQDLAAFDSQYQSCVMQTVHMTQAFVPEIIATAAESSSSIPNAQRLQRKHGALIQPQSAVWTDWCVCWQRSSDRIKSQSIRLHPAGQSRKTTAAIIPNRSRNMKNPCRSADAELIWKSRRCVHFWHRRSPPLQRVPIFRFPAAE